MSTSIPNIKQLAPDAATFSRAKLLSRSDKWRLLQANTAFVWGECKSKGTRYYKTIVDLRTNEAYCNCPSKKIPCKHALALLQLAYRQTEFFETTTDMPDWVTKRLSQRHTSSSSSAQPDQRRESVEKNRQKRIELMQAGCVELEHWLQDVFQQGLASLDLSPTHYWTDLSARMVDAKLGGVSRRIQSLLSAREQPDWYDELLEQLAAFYLLTKGFQQLDQLPIPLRSELLNVAGMSLRKQDILTQKGLKDYWLVIGQTEGEEAKLRYRRTWLLGKNERQFALLLDYVWGEQSYDQMWTVGQLFWGEVVYYPANDPLRAVVKFFENSQIPFDSFYGSPNLHTFLQQYAQRAAANPWIRIAPALLEQLVPIYDTEQQILVLVDQDSRVVRVPTSFQATWSLLAISGGHPINLFGEWCAHRFLPLAAQTATRLVQLS
ncbi:MAG: SWIM zinc finger family protein [Bacteroidota bacterium]